MGQLRLSQVIIYDITDKSAIKNALLELAKDDDFFNGSKGLDFVDDDVKEAGYDSNAVYYAKAEIFGLPSDYGERNVKKAIEDYIATMTSRPGYKQVKYEINFFMDMAIISFAADVVE